MGKLSRSEKRAAKKENTLLEITDVCINCNEHIALDQPFCSYCGGKRIYNKLTWRNLIIDFIDRFFNLENSFLKTFIAMFRCPEDVIVGYMKGMRKKYLPAFSYFAVALTIAGLFGFVLKNYFMDDVIEAQIAANTSFAASPEQIALQKELSEGWVRDYLNWVTDHQSLVYFALVPFLALLSRVVFWNYKKHNLVEHFVIYLYAFSHIAMITTTIGLLFIWNSKLYQIVSLFSLPLMILYIGWVLKRVFELDVGGILLKTALFTVVISGTIVVMFVVLVATQVSAVVNGEEVDNPIGKAIKMGYDRGQRKKEAKLLLKDSLAQDSLLQLKNTNLHTIELQDSLYQD